jgi:putative tryptophan/tyrosine transport system substrate-binding protein
MLPCHRFWEGWMRRREFIAGVGGAAAWPVVARAQQPRPVVGLFSVSTPATDQLRIDAFLRRLRELGWIEGQTISFEYRWAEGRPERFVEIAADLTQRKVNVIVTAGAGPVNAIRHATSLIPVVFAIASDPVGTGLVASLARPGGNAAGLSYLGPDLAAKRLELSRELIVHFARLAVMVNRGAPGAMLEMREMLKAADTIGLYAAPFEIQHRDDIAPTFEAIRDHTDALYVCADPLVNTNRLLIVEGAIAARLPTIFGERENVQVGGLISYGPNVPAMFRRAADLVDKILRGEKAGEIPVEQPTNFELVINLKTAKSLGISVPPTLLARADEVIE